MNYFNKSPSVPNSPCIECKDRCLGCHGVCRVYKEWAQKMQEMNHKRRAMSFGANMTRADARPNERERRRKKKNMLGRR